MDAEGGKRQNPDGGLDYERAVLAGGPLRIWQACLGVALSYVRDRKQSCAVAAILMGRRNLIGREIIGE